MKIKKLSQIAITVSILIFCSQLALTQTKSVSHKTRLVTQLLKLTEEGFPTDTYENVFASSNGELFAELRNQFLKSIANRIESDAELSSAQKEKYKENLPELAESVSSLFVSKVQNGIEVKVWTREILFDAYSKYTVAELNKLLTFFNQPAGKSFLKYNRDVADKTISKSDGPEPILDTRYAIRMDTFLKSAIGKKFYDTFMKRTAEKINERIAAWQKGYMNSLNRVEFEEKISEFKAKYAIKE